MCLRPSLVALALAVGALSACSGDDDGAAPPSAPAGDVSELESHGGEPCPAALPQREETDGAAENDDPATELPSVAIVGSAVDAAWVCRYEPASPGWTLTGSADKASTRDLARLGKQLGDLALPESLDGCSGDLGPRWLLVTAAGGDLSGVVVDDFGCRAVRLTDEPFETPPGDATADGTVSGVLSGPRSLVQALELAWVSG